MSTIHVATVMKNEAPYVAEWLEFHRAAGIGHFYLYLNDCTDDTASRLAPFAQSGDVTVLHQDGHPCQGPAFACRVSIEVSGVNVLIELSPPRVWRSRLRSGGRTSAARLPVAERP